MILDFNTSGHGYSVVNLLPPLTGETFSGQMIQGSDSVETAGCK